MEYSSCVCQNKLGINEWEFQIVKELKIVTIQRIVNSVNWNYYWLKYRQTNVHWMFMYKIINLTSVEQLSISQDFDLDRATNNNGSINVKE